ncbi:MAG: hypothetical protein MJE68_25630 [Proteobacteria bacterium]|nr:hypothetical protein [Pseudomonadota bacterium]
MEKIHNGGQMQFPEKDCRNGDLPENLSGRNDKNAHQTQMEKSHRGLHRSGAVQQSALCDSATEAMGNQDISNNFNKMKIRMCQKGSDMVFSFLM